MPDTDSLRRPEPPDRDRSSGIRVPRVALLDAWAQADWTDACELNQLAPLQVLTVETVNTSYEIVIVSGADGEVLVRGGRFFPERCPVRLAGSSLGASFLKLRSIHVGLCMELHGPDQVVITSPVRSVWIHPPVGNLPQ
jgi:hypothetical protein